MEAIDLGKQFGLAIIIEEILHLDVRSGTHALLGFHRGSRIVAPHHPLHAVGDAAHDIAIRRRLLVRHHGHPVPDDIVFGRQVGAADEAQKMGIGMSQFALEPRAVPQK